MAAHADMMARLRKGEAGRYEFHLIQGESYEALEDYMAEARNLALQFDGTFHVRSGSDTRPESFVVEI